MIVTSLARPVSRRARFAFLSAVLLVTTAAADDANVADYSIASIEYLPSPLEKIGKVQAGLLCLPKGKLRWRDVARPGDHAIAARVEDVLRSGGLSVAPQPDPLYGDAPPATLYRIRVVVTVVTLRLCVAGDVLFVGKVGPPPYTRGTITVRWETYDRFARQKIDAVTYAMPVDDRAADARTASHVLSNAIEPSAVRYAVSRPR